MQLSTIHIVSMVLTIAAVLGAGIYAARGVQSAAGYALGGRSSGGSLVAGTIAGAVVGGGATVGTAQLAFHIGMPAWWFTLGSGLTFLIMGYFYAKSLRESSLTTISQYLVLHYGKRAGTITSVVASLGIFLSAVASSLPGIGIISAMLGIGVWQAAGVLVLLTALYTFFGGMKSAGIGGILKMVVVWVTLCVAGFVAYAALPGEPVFSATFPPMPWQSLFGRGVSSALAQFFSLIVGILCTQTYIQALFSASSPRVASVGAYMAAAIVIPVGLPSVAIGMFMHAYEPSTMPLLVLPTFLANYLPDWFGGIALGGIMLSLVSSIGGLTLGIGTMISYDIFARVFPQATEQSVFRVSRISVLAVMLASCVVAIVNLHSDVLTWNYISMALRGGGIFLPLSIAVFCPHRVSRRWAVASMLFSTLLAVLSAVLHIAPISPVFLGLIVSAVMLVIGYVRGNDGEAADAES